MIGAFLTVAGWAGSIFSAWILVVKIVAAFGRPTFNILPPQLLVVAPTWLQATEVMLAMSLLMIGLGRMIELLERR
jgi:hypothetical protein